LRFRGHLYRDSRLSAQFRANQRNVLKKRLLAVYITREYRARAIWWVPGMAWEGIASKYFAAPKAAHITATGAGLPLIELAPSVGDELKGRRDWH
jgi:hypothetical protein